MKIGTTKPPLGSVAVALLSCVVVGCVGSGGSSTDEASADTSRTAQPLLRYGSEAARELGFERQAWTGDFDHMAERRIIRALVTYSKTYYFLDGLEQRGTSYEGFKLFEEWVNEELGTGHLKVHVLLIPVPRDRLLPALEEGYGDIASGGLTITPARRQIVDFSDPIMGDVSEIVVTGPTAPPLASLDDLAGKEVYVRASSSYYESLQDLNTKFEAANRPAMTLTPAEEYLEDEDLLEMVDAGLIPIVIVDEHKAAFWDQIFDNVTLHPDLAVRTGAQLGWAFRKDSPLLADVVNRFVAEHRVGTLMGNIILNRYLKDTTRVRNALSQDDRARFRETVGFFETYAPRYGFDHLMMMAQGYQESGLDQSVVSPAGAVGIMQLLPSTAADDAVGIPDIDDPESNVHAGVKYMRWIGDTYFQDDEVDDLNKTLFSFASYNAGPNRIRRLRQTAAERGLDPNVWFRNVEVIAAEAIGRETVQYVSNIYKYYAAYRLLTERQQLRDPS